MIKDLQNPPICSECGGALLYKLKSKFQDVDVRKCVKCGYMTDISMRMLEDHRHAEFEEIGVDPKGGTFNIGTGKWVCKE